jgi:hypothetical protein
MIEISKGLSASPAADLGRRAKDMMGKVTGMADKAQTTMNTRGLSELAKEELRDMRRRGSATRCSRRERRRGRQRLLVDKAEAGASPPRRGARPH